MERLSSSRSRSARRAVLAAAAMLAGGIAVPALAQTYPLPNPPVIYSVDANGVDLVTGDFYLRDRPLSIGTGEAGLTFHISEGGTSFSTYDTRMVPGASGITVNLGTISDFFTVSGTYSTFGTGAKLTHDASGYSDYTTRDGTIYRFDGAYREEIRRVSAKVGTITYPNGRVVTLHYDTVKYRLHSPYPCEGLLNLAQAWAAKPVAHRSEGVTTTSLVFVMNA